MKKRKLIYFLCLNFLKLESYGFFKNEIELKKQGFKNINYEKRILKGNILISSEKLNKEYSLNVEAIYDRNNSKLLIKDYSNYDELIEKKEIVLHYKKNKINTYISKELIEKENGFYYVYLDELPENIDSIYYNLKVYDAHGNYDLTKNKKLQILKSITNEKLEKIYENIKGDSIIKEKNIFSTGSKVKLYGKDFIENQIIKYKEKEIIINSRGEFLYDEILEEGVHELKFKVYSEENFEYEIVKNIKIENKEIFYIGLADVTISNGRISGNSDLLRNEKAYNEDILTEGRLAFYTKNSFSKYNITGYLDTDNQKIDEIYKGLGQRNKRELFKDFSEKNKGYTFGDESTIIADVETQGQFYLKLDWEKNKVLWGNYKAEISQGEFLNYSKSLYGAQVYLESLEKTKFQDSVQKGTVFFSNPDVSSGFNIFLATGGSLYYLKNKDLVEGSENIKIEVKNIKTGRVIKEISLSQGEDYQINFYQGRIILNKPLYQYGYLELEDVLGDYNLKDIQTYLNVSYEYYNYNLLYNEESIFGVEYSKWLSDNWKVGLVSVESSEKDEVYRLKGISQTFKYSNESYIDMEYAESSGNKWGKGYFSSSGGLNFQEINGILDENEPNEGKGKAYNISGLISLNELNKNINENSVVEFWYSKKDSGFAVESLTDGIDETEYGLISNFNINSKTNFEIQYNYLKEDQEEESYGAFVNYLLTKKLKLELGVTRDISDNDSLDNSKEEFSENNSSTINILTKAQYTFNERLSGYVGINKNDIEKEDDYSVLLGADMMVTEKLLVGLEAEKGKDENEFLGKISYSPFKNYETYLNLEKSISIDDENKGIVFGQKTLLNEKYEIFQENRLESSDGDEEANEAYGLGINIKENLKLSFVYEKSQLTSSEDDTKRNSISMEVDYRDRTKMKMNSRLEYTEEKNKNEKITEWLTSNNFQYKLNKELTIANRIDLGIGFNKTEDQVVRKLVDVTFGLAYRPIWNDRFNFLGKYSFVYDKNDNTKEKYDFDNLNERMSIFSIDGIYSITKKLDVGAKYAFKISEMKAAADESDWYSTKTSLYGVSAEYKFYKNISLETEYHWLVSKENNEVKSGAIVGLNTMVNDNLKVGVGYNFTKFSDNLKYENYNAQGFFINITGVF